MEQKAKERDHEYVLRKMEYEIKLKEATVVKSEHEDDNGDVAATGHSKKEFLAKGPKMPCIDDRVDDMDAFLHRFEVYADSQGWKEDKWAVYLSALLKGKALDVYSRLPVKYVQDYDILKDALLKRFNLTEEGFKQKFSSVRPESGEAPTQFIARLENYLIKWIDLPILIRILMDF